MSEVLKAWFQKKLGVMIDLSLDIFGHRARDGTLMAEILHSYHIINDSQLNTIIHTHDPSLCRINLNNLKVWLRFIGVEYDNQSINDISNGKGCAAIRLFCKIYLALENKDSFRSIIPEQDRENFFLIPTKFDVTKVSEEEPPSEPFENPLAAPLVEKSETIQWYQEKCKDIIKACKLDRERFKKSQKRKSKINSDIGSVPVSKVAEMKQSETKAIEDFERKQKSQHEIHGGAKNKRFRRNFKVHQDLLSAVEEYLKKTKKQRDQDETVKNFKNRMQKLLLSEIWEKMLQDQENKLDEIIEEKVLTQSQYEKRMITNLTEIHLQKNRIPENRQMADDLIEKAKEDEVLLEHKRNQEIEESEKKELNDEWDKFCELQRRIHEEHVRIIKEKNEKICSKIVCDLVDVSIKAAEYLKEETFIPLSLWIEWKALFIKSQPLFQSVEDLGNELEEEDREKVGVSQTQLERPEFLNTIDFEAYHNVESPWDKYLPEIDNETKEILRLGRVVLGYIVHKLLEFLYPYPPDPEPSIPDVDKKIIILGLPNQMFCSLQKLLETSEIKLMSMKDAVHYCLTVFKEEMKNNEYISLTPFNSQEKLDKPKEESAKKSTKKTKSRKSSKAKPNVSNLLDKQIQTPKNIPHEDMNPVLSEDASIGKWTYDILSAGQSIPVELNTKILIQYLKSLKNIKGWAIVDYPNNYEQMISLEEALTGSKFPSNDSDLFSIKSKIIFENESLDSFSIYRYSKLVPNPIIKIDQEPKTFMTNFIRVVAKSQDLDKNIFEILSDDATPMDTFYANHGIANIFYYFDFDASTLKKLARLIIGDKSLPRKSSSDLFGEANKKIRQSQTVSPSSVKQLIPKFSEMIQSRQNSLYSIDEEERQEEDSLGSSDLSYVIKPGEESWEWANFSQPNNVLEPISILWENLETSYVANLKDIFFIKRIHTEAILPFQNFVLKHMEEFISRPDIKQDIFDPFYQEFNSVDQVMRHDSDIKCKLQCRAADIQSELFDVCDNRKKESEGERQRMVEDDWTAIEAITFINVYIEIIQVEIDRCTDTIQILQDYYNSMMQKPLGNRVPKVQLLKLDTSADVTTQRSKESINVESTKKKKSKNDFASDPPAAINFELIKDEITDLLLDDEMSDPCFNETICCKAVKVNIEYCESIVDSLASSFNDTIKKVEKKGKSKKSRQDSSESVDNLGKYRNLQQEWYYATMFEINRIKMRLKMLDKAFLFDISYLLDSIQKIFHLFRKNLVHRYEREINSVNEMTGEFWLAVEEERPIKEEMFFDGDRFVIKKSYIEELSLFSEEEHFSENEMA